MRTAATVRKTPGLAAAAVVVVAATTATLQQLHQLSTYCKAEIYAEHNHGHHMHALAQLTPTSTSPCVPTVLALLVSSRVNPRCACSPSPYAYSVLRSVSSHAHSELHYSGSRLAAERSPCSCRRCKYMRAWSAVLPCPCIMYVVLQGVVNRSVWRV